MDLIQWMQFIYQKPFHAICFCVQLWMAISLNEALCGQLDMLTQLSIENLALFRCKASFVDRIKGLKQILQQKSLNFINDSTSKIQTLHCASPLAELQSGQDYQVLCRQHFWIVLVWHGVRVSVSESRPSIEFFGSRLRFQLSFHWFEMMLSQLTVLLMLLLLLKSFSRDSMTIALSIDWTYLSCWWMSSPV